MNRALVPLLHHTVKQFTRDGVVASDGPAGRVRDVYFEDQGWKVRYLVVDTGGWLSGRRVLVPPAAVDALGSGGGRLRVALTRAELKQAPDADTQRPVWRQAALAQAVQFGYPYYWSGLVLWGAAGIGRSRADAERAAHAEFARGDRHLRSGAALIGSRVEARDGPLGEIEDFVVDERGWTISEVRVRAGSRWRGRELRVAPQLIERIDWSEQRVRVRLARDELRDLRVS